MDFKNLKEMLMKTWKYLAVALVVTIFLRSRFGPAFFDLFGLILFIGLILLGVNELSSNKQMPDWIAFLLICVGLMGLIVDGVTSYQIIKEWVQGLI